MTSARLALLCKDWLKVPVGYMDDASYSVSPKQFVRAMGCISYIEGTADALLESAGNNTPYNPKTGQLSAGREEINYFVRYVDQHPEDNELAAVTVLRQCEMEKSRK